MIKLLFKTLIAVLLLLIILPLCKLLARFVTHLLVDLGVCVEDSINPWGAAAIIMTCLAFFFIWKAIKS